MTRARRRRITLAVAAGAAALLAAPLGAADQPAELLPGKIAVVKPAKLLKFVSRPPAAALPDESNAPTVAGASLRAFDTAGGTGGDTHALPAAGWKGLGRPPGSKGYKFEGAPGDACRVVLVKPAVVKAVCRGPAVTLTPPLEGALGLVLTLGGASKAYCLEFGGTPMKNQPGILKRKDAAAPGACPAPPVPLICGDGATAPGEQCDDGNTLHGDGCNGLCESEAVTCSPRIGSRQVTVSITTPQPLAGARFDLEYPQLHTSIPGWGNSSLVRSRVQIFPVGGLAAVNDQETDLTIVLANATPFIDSGPVFSIDFDACTPLEQNMCNRAQNVIGCCADAKVCEGDGATPCTGDADCAGVGGPCVFDPDCMFDPPLCPSGSFPPPDTVGPCSSPAGACPGDNVCVTQVENTACTVSEPVDQLGQVVAGVTCTVSITQASPSGAFLDDIRF